MSATTRARESAPTRNRRRLGVGARLIAAFAVLALLPVAAGVLGIFGTQPVQQPLVEIAAVADTFGRFDRGFRRHSRGVNMLFAQPRNFADRERFDETLSQVDRRIAGMRKHIAGLAASAGGAGLQADYDALEAELTNTLATTGERITAMESVERLIDEIYLAGEQIVATATLAAAGADANLSRRLDALGYQAVTLGALVRDADKHGEHLAKLRADFAARLRGALAELAYLPDTDYRRELGATFETIFTLALEPGGLFATMDRVVALRDRELYEVTSMRRNGLALVERIGELDQANDAEVSRLAYAADAALERSNLAQIAVGALAVAISAFIVVVVVRGSVLRRLDGLTKSTRALTSGQLEEPVPRDGADELTELAGALEAFRHSALALRRSERKLKERTEELEHANRELDQFAYVASHDLKAPMRAIDSLAGFLRDDIGESLDGDSRRHLDMMQGRIRRLEALLDSLLEYSRAGRIRAPQEPVDLRRLVEDAVDTVLPHGEQVSYSGDFGRVCTWKTPLEQIVRNLVDNAFKHNDHDAGLVTVECDLAGGKVRLLVSDMGSGIEPEFHERIFGMFQTLRPRDQVEGSGMGLAILKKLVDAYGGSIEVHSEPATRPGTEFVVHWPYDAALPSAAANDIDSKVLERLRATA